MPLSAAQPPGVNDRGNHQDQQVGAFQGPVGVHDPGVAEGREGEEKESQYGQEKPVVGALQVVREEKQQRQDHAREGQNHEQQEARRLASILANRNALARCVLAPVESSFRMNSPQRTVLIVDDDRQILGLVEKMLRPQGVAVLLANRPSEALRICEGQRIDVLISDILMPEMDGGKLAERLLKLQPEARVLLISGQAREPAVTKHLNVRFLRKPFFPSAMLQNLRELLEQIEAA